MKIENIWNHHLELMRNTNCSLLEHLRSVGSLGLLLWRCFTMHLWKKTCKVPLEPETSVYKWLFQLYDEPNHYIKSGCFTKHPFKTGCLGYQAYTNLLSKIFRSTYAHSNDGNLPSWEEKEYACLKHFAGDRLLRSQMVPLKNLRKTLVYSYIAIFGYSTIP